MVAIGIRELRQRASEYLRRVEAGETFEVTDRGRPVALLSPITETTPLERMRRSGQLSPAIEDSFPEPVDSESIATPPTEVLRNLRANER
ncbi:MAG: type II toxin-antitoxin system prevent-host-death family antitoxin [Acidimicrobiales bacterium]